MTTEKRLLSPAAAEAIRAASRAGEGIALASSSLWEVAMITTRGGFRLPSTLGDYLKYLETVFVVLPISGVIAERSMQFSENYPKDPTDRLIGATALVHGLALVTRDEKIRASGEVRCIW